MRRALALLLIPMGLQVACKDLSPPIPAGVQDERDFRTPDGAMIMYRGALTVSNTAFFTYMNVSALFTDEFTAKVIDNPNQTGNVSPTGFDPRNLASATARNEVYHRLHAVRSNTSIAVQALKAYAPETPVSLQGEMYALHGMAVTYLADLFCSGVPLSTVNFAGDFTYKPGSTTAHLYTHAIALFDTALSLAGDSLRVKHLAQVGRGRAFLALARFREAADAVRDVPDSFAFRLPISLTTSLLGASVTLSGAVSDREGTNGMPYRTSNDPRSRAQLVVGANTPVKYIVNATNREAWLTIADGDEARLIEAEVDLRNNGTQWLRTLNELRTNGTFTVSPTNDTLWKAGSGGYDGLRPLTDPARSPIPGGMDTTNVRVNLLFAERAYWLFVTGRRQGDLRRLVRQYGRDPETVYPTGPYGPTGLARYGSDVTVPVPDNEYLYNGQYTGCENRDA